MSEAELTSEARDAIRTYMLKFVIPSGVLLTIVSGALGYVVSGMARIDASSEAAKYALQAAGKAAEANANAAQAAIEAADSRTKALNASTSAEGTQRYLLSVKDQVDKILTGQYEGLAKALFAIQGFQEAVGTIPQKEVREINTKLDVLTAAVRGGILAAGQIKGGKMITQSDGVKFEYGSGKVSFPNPRNVSFVPVVSEVTPGSTPYSTGTCFIRGEGPDFFILWAGARDTGDRNNPPADCTFIVVAATG